MRFLVFEENPPIHFFFVFRLWFSFKNNIRTNVFFGRYFWKRKKNYSPSKTPFLLFFWLIKVCKSVFKNTDQSDICVSIVLKAKTEKNEEKRAFFSFEIKTIKTCFFICFFCFTVAIKTIDAQMLFLSVFLKTQKKTVINLLFFILSWCNSSYSSNRPGAK